MNEVSFDDGPLISCSTGGQEACALHVIRLSGFENLQFLKGIFSVEPERIKPRYAHYGKLIDLEGNLIDELVLTYFKAPHSYTGEEMLELSVHGNPLNVERVLNFFMTHFNFRQAKGGEFTYRALLNEKLSLAQVEGLDMLLNAQNPLALDQGLQLLNGELEQKYERLYQLYLQARSLIEIAIDFSDDVGEDQLLNSLSASLGELEQLTQELYLKCSGQDSVLLNPQVVLFGPANAGKSTLFNQLLQSSRSIVSSEEGTTRDYVTEAIQLGPSTFRLIDTAGLRETDSSIESDGIERTLKLLSTAFYRILVLSSSQTQKVIEWPYVPDLIIVSHADLHEIEDSRLRELNSVAPVLELDLKELKTYRGPIEPGANSGPIEPGTKSGPIEPGTKSGPIEPGTKSGPIEPRSFIFSIIENRFLERVKSSPILLDRHRLLIHKLYKRLQRVPALRERDYNDLAVVDHEINELGSIIAELVGVIRPDDVLNHIFSHFCIGK